MRIRNYILASLSLIVTLLISCESDKRPEETVGTIPDVVSFSEHVLPIFEGKSDAILIEGKNGRACIDCHNGTTPPNLTADFAYSEVTDGGFTNVDSPADSKIIKKITPGGSMNVYTNATDIAIIQKWIEQGAQDN